MTWDSEMLIHAQRGPRATADRSVMISSILVLSLFALGSCVNSMGGHIAMLIGKAELSGSRIERRSRLTCQPLRLDQNRLG